MVKLITVQARGPGEVVAEIANAVRNVFTGQMVLLVVVRKVAINKPYIPRLKFYREDHNMTEKFNSWPLNCRLTLIDKSRNRSY